MDPAWQVNSSANEWILYETLTMAEQGRARQSRRGLANDMKSSSMFCVKIQVNARICTWMAYESCMV